MSLEIRRTLELAADPRRVWDALTDPAELGRWFPDEADLRAAAGSDGAFVWERHGRFAVRVETFEPPRRLVWRWARDPDVDLDGGPTTTVEWTLEARDDGGTTLHLVERGFATPEHRKQNEGGWEAELAELVAHLERAPAGAADATA